MKVGERSAVISGVGQSAVGRDLTRDPVALTVDATRQALASAGLTRDAIDGVATWPGSMPAGGFSPVTIRDLREAMGLELDWFSATAESAGQLGAIFAAIGAVTAGFARHVVCFRTLAEASARREARSAPDASAPPARVAGWHQWLQPFGAVTTAPVFAMYARRHMHEYGTTREQLGQIPLACRRHAMRNPAAIYREPLTLDDYLEARMISTPLCLYDCDVPIDGSTVVIVSSVDASADLRRPPIAIEAVGSALHERDSWDQRPDLTTMAASDAAAMMWSRTDLKPDDVDTIQLYDGFSFIALAWIEALGFCGRGEGGDFVEDGRTISLGGALPMNTNGGQLSAGRLHGFGYLHEACTQLWGDGGERQVEGAEVAIATAGGGPLGGCMLLTRSA